MIFVLVFTFATISGSICERRFILLKGSSGKIVKFKHGNRTYSRNAFINLNVNNPPIMDKLTNDTINEK